MQKALFGILLILLIYTRFINIDWGLPYPFHPDERNMAVALQSLHCDTFEMKECMNPHFFAYGQFPLYLGYIGIQIYHILHGSMGQPLSFEESVIALRVISALASILNIFILFKIIEKFVVHHPSKNQNGKDYFILISFLILIFAPYFIQFAHFGTTESLLMLFYSIIVYLCLRLYEHEGKQRKEILLLGLVSGIALATKLSALIFIALPLLILLKLYLTRHKFQFSNLINIAIFLLVTAVFAVLFSPHNLISLNDFMGSMSYESSVGTGELKVFYTRQFEHAIPIVFQLLHIFPYTLGWPLFVLSVLGFIFLPFTKPYNILRVAILLYFIPNAFFYTKWTRFMAPIFPLMTVIGILFIYKISSHIKIHYSSFVISAMCFICIIPGIAYLSIYTSPDVRFTASNWIYTHIPSQTTILSEGANVVDIPIPNKELASYRVGELPSYTINSFFLYDVDQDPLLQSDLNFAIQKSDYIIVPSRRVFMNIDRSSPVLNRYYDKLFSGSLGFKEVARFTSYPRIVIFGKTLIEFPDEEAEETWTVFDHPVIRIYKRN